MITKQWLNEREVSELTGIALSTLRNARYYNRGIRYSKISKSVRYSIKDINDFFAGSLVEVDPQ